MPNVIVEQRTHPPLTGRCLKVTIAHQPTELLTQPVQEGTQRVTLRINVQDRTVTAEIAAKSLRRAQTTINEVGAEAVAVILQGKLIANDVISQAGLSVQLKTTPQPPTSQ